MLKFFIHLAYKKRLSPKFCLNNTVILNLLAQYPKRQNCLALTRA